MHHENDSLFLQNIFINNNEKCWITNLPYISYINRINEFSRRWVLLISKCTRTHQNHETFHILHNLLLGVFVSCQLFFIFSFLWLQSKLGFKILLFNIFLLSACEKPLKRASTEALFCFLFNLRKIQKERYGMFCNCNPILKVKVVKIKKRGFIGILIVPQYHFEFRFGPHYNSSKIRWLRH